MSRLTDKKGIKFNDIENLEKVYTKLGKLEDLEDELGCPLEVVFEALKDNEIVVRHARKKVKLHKISSFQFEFDEKHFSLWVYDFFYFFPFSVNLKDYKKTWCLKGDLSK